MCVCCHLQLHSIVNPDCSRLGLIKTSLMTKETSWHGYVDPQLYCTMCLIITSYCNLCNAIVYGRALLICAIVLTVQQWCGTVIIVAPVSSTRSISINVYNSLCVFAMKGFWECRLDLVLVCVLELPELPSKYRSLWCTILRVRWQWNPPHFESFSCCLHWSKVVQSGMMQDLATTITQCVEEYFLMSIFKAIPKINV